MYEYNTVDEFLSALEVAVQEAAADNPDVNPDDVYADLVDSLKHDAAPSLWSEIHRVTGTQDRTTRIEDAGPYVAPSAVEDIIEDAERHDPFEVEQWNERWP